MSTNTRIHCLELTVYRNKNEAHVVNNFVFLYWALFKEETYVHVHVHGALSITETTWSCTGYWFTIIILSKRWTKVLVSNNLSEKFDKFSSLSEIRFLENFLISNYVQTRQFSTDLNRRNGEKDIRKGSLLKTKFLAYSSINVFSMKVDFYFGYERLSWKSTTYETKRLLSRSCIECCKATTVWL